MSDKVGANGRQDGVGKTSSLRGATEPADAIWIRSHEHHTGPRPRVPHQEAAHTTVPDLNATDPLFEVRLANRGASTYGRYARGQLAARGAVAKLRYGA